jgi:hypothetical protein
MSGKITLNIKKQKALSTETLPDFENDPAYIRAKERARAILNKAPLPDSIAKKLRKKH